ncbi:MAG: tyrosine-type recombinase/integrase [Deltaproteobacteria bacterium]|nr:tyrosine-type recombinase/integrase [Deltaproteobacteria bacterium]
MLEHYFKRPRVQARIRKNVLYPPIRKLVRHLHDCGYGAVTIQSYVQKIEHFGNWLARNDMPVESVNRDTIHTFLDRHLPRCHCTLPCSCDRKDVRAALNGLLYTLPARCRRPQNPPATPVDKEIRGFRAYMTNVCGLSPATIHYRTRIASEFLMDTFGRRCIKYRDITPCHVMEYVANKAKQYKPGSTKVLTSSLRSYFRYLQFGGKCSHNLIEAVPNVPDWKLATLPKTMTQEQLSRFLSSFDRTTASGQRDYAMALCFLELGMRACEVTTLLLDDIDWKNATIKIRVSKTLRTRILPFSDRLGRALACYVKNGRPMTNSRNLFIRHSVPKGKPITIYIVRATMRYAHERAGLAD